MPVDLTLTEHQEGADQAPPPQWGLVVLACPDPSRVGEAHSIGSRVSIGREGGEGLDLAFADRKQSRRHATVRRRGSLDAFTIADQGSKNGTFVDGRRVEREDLTEGALVRVGGTLLELRALPRQAPAARDDAPDDEIVGSSAPLRAMLAEVDRVARSPLSALLLGETGTGKELVARRIHRVSGRGGELVAVNCAAIPRDLAEASFFGHRKGAFTGATADAPGYFSRADGGTLFLDEIGELPLDLQPKLLRALETQRFVRVGDTAPQSADVRFVCATNVDLRGAVEAGEFRADLYARVAGYVVHIPPLRTRRDDIVPLMQHFLRQAVPDRAIALGPGLVEQLLLYAWPMNIRELRSLAQRLALCEQDGPLPRSVLPPEFEPRTPAAAAAEASAPVGAPDREQLIALLSRYQGSVAKVASHFGKDRRQVYRWLKKWGLSADDYR